MIHNIAGEQRKAGNWTIAGVARPPMEDGDFSRTAICLRSLAAFPLPGRKAEFDERIQRAAAWLKAATPRTTEDRSMQLLGLKWANVDRRELEDRLKKLIALQRADGGWAQTPDLTSDAYATGEVLHTISELGISANDDAYRRGVTYLLKTQLADGSWHVASRAPKFQPYFQSGFPHDHDQWISSAATAWATMALTHAISGPAVADAVQPAVLAPVDAFDAASTLAGYGFSNFTKLNLFRQDKGHVAEITGFVARIASGGEPFLDAATIWNVTAASLAAVEAAKKGCRVAVQ